MVDDSSGTDAVAELLAAADRVESEYEQGYIDADAALQRLFPALADVRAAVEGRRTEESLLEAAREAYEHAYVPYSEYPVGAALETDDGRVYTGCNIENANYSNSLHAEGVAVAKAVSDGRTGFRRIAVASAARDGVTPCGRCRQTLAEFADESLAVLCDEGDDAYTTYALGDLLPEAISPETLSEAARPGN